MAPRATSMLLVQGARAARLAWRGETRLKRNPEHELRDLRWVMLMREPPPRLPQPLSQPGHVPLEASTTL